MAILKKFDFMGNEVGEETFEDSWLQKEVNEQMVKDYVVALCKNARQWSANTKTRSEVNKVKQKPQQQKGLGRARQGFLGAPQFKGGGRAFGPKPKFDQHVKINKKEKRLIIQSLLAKKILENRVFILESDVLEKPKTKLASEFLKKININNDKVLFIGQSDAIFSGIVKSVKNIPRKFYTYLSRLNGYELMLCQDLIIVSSAIDGVKEILSKKVGE